MYSIGNEELKELPMLAEEHKCSRCNKVHTVQYGQTKTDDGKWVECKMLAFVTCDDGKSYLVGINGKDITNRR